MIGTDDENHYWDCHAAADEIERLREAIRRLADQDATLSVSGGNVTVTLDATLTDQEREAIETAVRWLEPYPPVAATLRKLLERTK
jgi:predicted DNA binding protein